MQTTLLSIVGAILLPLLPNAKAEVISASSSLLDSSAKGISTEFVISAELNWPWAEAARYGVAENVSAVSSSYKIQRYVCIMYVCIMPIQEYV